jgi:hypothetical protein
MTDPTFSKHALDRFRLHFPDGDVDRMGSAFRHTLEIPAEIVAIITCNTRRARGSDTYHLARSKQGWGLFVVQDGHVLTYLRMTGESLRWLQSNYGEPKVREAKPRVQQGPTPAGRFRKWVMHSLQATFSWGGLAPEIREAVVAAWVNKAWEMGMWGYEFPTDFGKVKIDLQGSRCVAKIEVEA